MLYCSFSSGVYVSMSLGVHLRLLHNLFKFFVVMLSLCFNAFNNRASIYFLLISSFCERPFFLINSKNFSYVIMVKYIQKCISPFFNFC